jgi:hypothetical protein
MLTSRARLLLAAGFPALTLTLGFGLGCSRAKEPAAPPTLEPRAESLGALTEVQGDVTVVGQDGTRRPGRAGPVGPNGRLVTGPGGHAVLTLSDGTRLEVAESDELSWQRSGGDLVVIPGRAAVLVQKAGKRPRPFNLVIKTPFGLARVPPEEVQASVHIDKRRAAFDVRLGHIEVYDNKGKRIEIRMGEHIEVMLAGIEIIRSDGTRSTAEAEEMKAPERPAASRAPKEAPPKAERGPLPAPPNAPLVLAMGSDHQIYGDQLKEVTLTWPAGGDATTVEVARDHLFKHMLVAGAPEGDHLNVVPPANGSLYWRVLDRQGGEIKRAKARFASDSSSGGGGRSAEATVSESGVTAKLYYQGVPPAVNFQFTPHPRAARYRLLVRRAGSRPKTVVEQTVDRARCRVKPGLLGDGQYGWKATPLDRAGAPIEEGRENQLSIAYDNAHVELAIEKPRPWQRVRGRRVEVQGVAPLESKLFINGKRAPLDEKGRFDFRVDPAAALIFRLVTPDGNETLWVRGLRVGS